MARGFAPRRWLGTDKKGLFHTRILGSVLPQFFVFLFSFSIKRENSINKFQKGFLEFIHTIFRLKNTTHHIILFHLLQKNNKHQLLQYDSIISLFLFILGSNTCIAGLRPAQVAWNRQKGLSHTRILGSVLPFFFVFLFSFSVKREAHKKIV